MNASSVRILLADDHEVVRKELRGFVEANSAWDLSQCIRKPDTLVTRGHFYFGWTLDSRACSSLASFLLQKNHF